jgi:hypothetical protein
VPADTLPTAPEPRCRNCGAAAPGAFCPDCGQETKAALPRLGEFVREALGRYVAIDGRLWKTLRGLLFRPGFLTREYLAGRRRRYIRPARLFLFASLVLFAVLRVELLLTESSVVTIDPTGSVMLRPGGDSRPGPATSPEASSARGGSSAAGRAATPGAATAKEATTGEAGIESDDLDLQALESRFPALSRRIKQFTRLPRAEKETRITDGLLRYGPYAMFILLPAFAGLLKIVYVGRRRRHPDRPRLYSEHMVFAAHNHAFLFLAIAAAVLAPFDAARAVLFVWMGLYPLLSMRRVYGGSWLGIVTRASLLGMAYLVLFGLVTAGLVIVAILLR